VIPHLVAELAPRSEPAGIVGLCGFSGRIFWRIPAIISSRGAYNSITIYPPAKNSAAASETNGLHIRNSVTSAAFPFIDLRRITVKNRLGSSLKLLSVALVAAVSLSALAAPLRAQATGEMKPVVLVTLSGYDALKQDINFIGSLAGQPELASQFEPFILGFTQGLEKDKPLGVLIQSDGMNFGGAICLPIKDLATFVANLKAFGVTTADAGNGVTQISANGQQLFGKNEGGWTFLSMMPQMLENLPADPAEAFSSLIKEYDLGIRANVQNIPEPYRQMAMQQLRAGMEAGMKRKDDENDEQYKARTALANSQVEQLERMIKEIDQFTFGLSVDSEQQRTFMDFVYTAVAGSQLAEQLKTMADPKTNFAGFFQPNAAGMMMVSSKINDSDIAQTKQMVESLRTQIATGIDEESDLPSDAAKQTAKDACNDFIDAMLATVEAGKMDAGAVMNLSPEALTVVAGGFIADPAKIESGLKKLAELGKEEPEMPPVKWNAESHAGVNFHTLSAPTPDEKEARQLFGETIDFAIGIGKDSVYFAMGRDCLAAAKKVIDDSAASPGKSIAPMELSVSVGQIINTIAAFDADDPVLKTVADTLKTEAVGRDHVRIVAQQIENGLRTRIEAEEGVMRAIGVGVKAAQMQAMGAVQEVPVGAAQ